MTLMLLGEPKRLATKVKRSQLVDVVGTSWEARAAEEDYRERRRERGIGTLRVEAGGGRREA